MLRLEGVEKGLGVRIGCLGYIHELCELLVELWDPGLLIVPFQLIPEGFWVFLVDPLVPEILGHMVHHEVLGLFLKPDVSLIANDLVLNLLDAVLAGLVVIDKVASDPSVVLCLGLAKGVNTGGSV